MPSFIKHLLDYDHWYQFLSTHYPFKEYSPATWTDPGCTPAKVFITLSLIMLGVLYIWNFFTFISYEKNIRWWRAVLIHMVSPWTYIFAMYALCFITGLATTILGYIFMVIFIIVNAAASGGKADERVRRYRDDDYAPKTCGIISTILYNAVHTWEKSESVRRDFRKYYKQMLKLKIS